CGIDPVELRVRNEPAVEPESGKTWSSRNLVACLREGAGRFGWAAAREPRREGRWLIGAGVAASTYPAYQRPSEASARALGDGRVERMLGVFAVGRIVNPKTARSQFIGGMTMGIGMALMEEGVMDREFGDYLNHDLAQYHVPVNADVRDVDATWIDETDDELNPMGSKGIGEIGIVG